MLAMTVGDTNMWKHTIFPFDLPLFSICITVAIILGVCAVPVDTTGTLLDARPRAAPVEMLLAASTNPPGVGGPIWEPNTDVNILMSLALITVNVPLVSDHYFSLYTLNRKGKQDFKNLDFSAEKLFFLLLNRSNSVQPLVHLGLYECFNEWIKGEELLPFNKKCNIVFFALNNAFWHGMVTTQGDKSKYVGCWQYITVRENETILHFALYSNKINCIVNIHLSNFIKANEISWDAF